MAAVNLLAPDLLAEAFITVAHDGTSHAYYSKLTRQDVLAVASAIVNCGIELAQRHGYKLELKGDPSK
jgi:hypothetical protein